MSTFGKKLKELRLKKGLLQRDIAEDLKVDSSAIGYWERGINEPKFNKLCEIADYFEVTPNYLLGYEEEINKKSDTLRKVSDNKAIG